MKRLLIFSLVIISIFSSSFIKKEKKWIAIGDSITYLNDHLDETKYRVSKGYLTRVVEKSPDLQVVNKGYNGWTSGNIAEKFDQIEVGTGDIYTVFLGTNDWWQGRPIGNFTDYSGNKGNNTIYGSFRIIIDKIRALNPRAEIILLTPLQRGDFVYINNPKNNAWGSYKEKDHQSLSQVADAILEIGKQERIKMVDLYHKSGITQQNIVKFKRLRDPETGAYKDYQYPEFAGIPFDPEKDAYPYPEEAVDRTYDGLHPSDQGNAVIAKMLVKALKK